MSDDAQTADEIATMENWAEGLSVADFNSSGDWAPPPVGVYHFKLTRKDPNQPVNPKFDPTGRKVQAKFYFEIIDCDEDPDLNGIEIRQFYTISLNEKANLKPVVEALIGRPLLPTDKMGWKDGTLKDGTSVVGIGGKLMTATLTHDKKEDGRVYARLIGPIPYKGKKVRSAGRPAREVDPANPPF